MLYMCAVFSGPRVLLALKTKGSHILLDSCSKSFLNMHRHRTQDTGPFVVCSWMHSAFRSRFPGSHRSQNLQPLQNFLSAGRSRGSHKCLIADPCDPSNEITDPAVTPYHGPASSGAVLNHRCRHEDGVLVACIWPLTSPYYFSLLHRFDYKKYLRLDFASSPRA